MFGDLCRRGPPQALPVLVLGGPLYPFVTADALHRCPPDPDCQVQGDFWRGPQMAGVAMWDITKTPVTRRNKT